MGEGDRLPYEAPDEMRWRGGYRDAGTVDRTVTLLNQVQVVDNHERQMGTEADFAAERIVRT